MPTITQWQMIGSQRQLGSGQRVTLRNRKVNKSVRYGEREYGINLVWDDSADLGNVTVQRQQTGTDPITYATPVALRVNGGGFLHYEEREYGINLVWSAEPRFEWEITGGTPGTPVPLNQRVALLNTLHGDHLIYDEREYGINLRWYADLDIDNSALFRDTFARYVPLPIPNALRAPSREAAQILVSGIARTVKLFHGRVDDELDWHIYVSLDPAQRRALTAHLRGHARFGSGINESSLDQLYGELMVLDGWRNPTFDEFFYSADVRRAFSLTQPAWDLSERAGNNQGDNLDLTQQSRLSARGTPIYLQGPFVNDFAHAWRPEIHPIDSIAYPLARNGTPLNITPDDAAWPENDVTWRVAVFTNSTFHRITGADYLEQDRRTIWLLDVPRAAARADGPSVLNQTTVTVSQPGFVNRGRGAQGLDDARPTAADTYARYRVDAASHALTPRSSPGGRLLRVDVRMGEPDRWGGMYLADYRIRVGPPEVLRDR